MRDGNAALGPLLDAMALPIGRLFALALLAGCSGSSVAQDPLAASSAPSLAGRPSLGVAGGLASAMLASNPPTLGAAGSAAAAAMSAGASTSLNLSGAPQYTRFVRLTNAQWARSVQDVLGLAAPSGLEAGFQSPVAGTTDFTNNELVLNVDQRAADDFQSAADELAKQVTASSATLARIYPGTDAPGFIAALGRRAYRRPLTSAESGAYLTLFNQGAALTGAASPFARGAGLVVRAMLQSPYFLYRTELGDVGTPLTSYEVAAKLSLWLRGTTPNDALLDAAAGPGALDTADGSARLAAAMLAESFALQVMRAFHNELYHFDRYTTISKLGVSDYDPALNLEYLESSYRYFDYLFSSDLGVKELLTSTQGLVGPRMAALYGVSPPASGYEMRELGPQRVGYFSQIPFLSLHGVNDEPDSIHRGVSMNLDVLCTVLGPPAADLPPVPALEPGQTNRQRISKLTEGCGGVCHNQQINPLGFAFEHFDGMGRYRDIENGNLPIVSRGSFTFSEGTQAFEGAAELMRALAAGKQAHRCYAKKLASFGLQRDIVDKDVQLLEVLTQTSMEKGAIKNIILALVRSDAFRVRTGANP